ncbi:MAG TPA: M48 family metallopeptidase, partial [Verrucomicrobiae bacterium]
MPEAAYAKCSCRVCETHLEFPVEAAGTVIKCPNCQQDTPLSIESKTPATAESPPTAVPPVTQEGVLASLADPVPKTPVSFLYQAGLFIVTLTMLALPLFYLAVIGAAAWGVFYWGKHGTFLLGSGGGVRVMIFKFLLYATPLFAGVVLVFFMIKPLFARRAPHAQPLALNPGAEPFLFSFVTRLCQTVGAPFPSRIDIDCQLNASAGFRRGVFSFLGNDLVLTIGLPLVAGLNLRQLAGVLAHEFGHFTQGFGLRLTYIIRSVNGWFARVAYERDAWDLMLDEWGETEEGRLWIVVNFARLGVWFSRLLLKLLMFFGHGIGCFMLRQMEYDADSYEIKLAGSDAFETTARRMHVLAHTLDGAYKALRPGWNNANRLPDDFPAWMLRH